MAVLLCREGKPCIVPVPSELRGLPRISLEYEPVPDHSSYQGKPVTTRTHSKFDYLDQPREKTMKDMHDRHQFQLTQCGFHASDSKPYTELGKVELDDGRLILETLGQAKKNEDDDPSQQVFVAVKEKPRSFVSPYQVKMRSKTSSQFPSKLLCLQDKIKQGEAQLNLMKKGRGLFQLMGEEQKMKEIEERKKTRENESAARWQWREAEVDVIGVENAVSEQPQERKISAMRRKSSLAMGNVEQSSPVNLETESGEVTGNIVDEWYRKLCVMIWILKAMQLESPNHAIPLSRCWDLHSQYVDDSIGKRRYEYSKQRLLLWEDMRKKKPVKSKSLRTRVSTVMAFSPRRKVEEGSIPQEGSVETHTSNTQKSRSIREEELRHDKFKKKLSEKLKAPVVSLDIAKMRTEFSDSDDKRRMIVHEQLGVMERDRLEALQQRLASLKISVNMWNDLSGMRKGLQIESTGMARKKLLMNYKWYKELVELVPGEVRSDHYCQQLLESLGEIAEYMYSQGPRKMSRRKLVQVLATLNPWELQAPDISGAVQHIIQHVVYVAEVDYKEWLKQHIHVHQYNYIQSKGGNVKLVRSPIRQPPTPDKQGLASVRH